MERGPLGETTRPRPLLGPVLLEPFRTGVEAFAWVALVGADLAGLVLLGADLVLWLAFFGADLAAAFGADFAAFPEDSLAVVLAAARDGAFAATFFAVWGFALGMAGK